MASSAVILKIYIELLLLNPNANLLETWDVFGLARRGSTIGFHLLWHTVELAMNTHSSLFIIVINLIFMFSL